MVARPAARQPGLRQPSGQSGVDRTLCSNPACGGWRVKHTLCGNTACGGEGMAWEEPAELRNQGCHPSGKSGHRGGT
jgi:hypothetical protein